MANTTISIRSSGDTGVTPSLGVIANGELALNFADGILYYKTASNTLGTITTTEPAGLNKEIQFNDSGSLGSNAGLTFDKTTGTFTVPSLNVASVYSLPVTDGTNGQLLTTDGSGTITFQDAPTPPANVSISTFSGTGDGSTVTYNLGYYPVSKEALLATIGGVLQDPSTAYTINQSNNTISFTSPPANTAPISVVSLYTNVTPIGPADVIVSNFITTANGVADTFDLGFNVTSANNLTVAVDGVLQTPTLHYTVNTTANTITFDSIPPSSSNISVVSLYTNVNTYADVIGTAAYAHANGAFDAANGASTLAQNAYDYANTIVSDTQVDPYARAHANGAFDAANTSQTHAEGAFTLANTNSTTDYTNVSITAGDYGSATIIPVVHLEANGRVSSVTNTAISTSSTSTAGIVQLYDGVDSTSTTTAATPNSVKVAYDHGDGAFTQANTNATNITTAQGHADGAFTHANGAFDKANTAQTHADGAFTQANTAQTTADNAQTHAESAYTQANTNASDITTTNNRLNSAFGHANAAYTQANTATTDAGSAQTHAEGAFTQANTNATNITTAQNHADGAFTHANGAFDAANTKFASAGGTITGDTTITGNLTVTGTRTFANTVDTLITDNIVTLNAAIGQASAPTLDAGIEIDRGSSANVLLLWNETSDKWTFTNDGSTYYEIPTNTSVTTAQGHADGAFTHANGAFDKANTAQTHAEGAFTQANTNATNITTAQNHADGAFTQANTNATNITTAQNHADGAFTHANGAFDKANTAQTHADGSFGHANGAFDAANTAQTHAEGAFTQANTNSTTDYTNVSITAGDYGSEVIIPVVHLEANGRVSSIANTSVRTGTTSVTGIVQLTDATNSTSTTTAATPNAVKSAYDLADTANTSATAAQSTADGAFTAANTAQSTADGAQTHAEGAFTQANTNASDITTAQNHANGAFNHANGAFGAANTAQTTADDAQTHAEGAFTQANTNASDITTTNSRLNSAFGHANSAFDTANTKFASAGGSISGDVSITGNLTVVGETVYANTTTALIADNIVTLNAAINQASAPASDAGLEIDRGSSANVSLLWNETSDKWTFTNDGSTYLPVADGDRLDSTFTHANGAFDAANTSQTHAEGAFTQANTNAINITTTQGHADGAFTHANGAFDAANTSQTHAEGAFTQANTNSTTDYTNVSVTGGTYGNASYIPSVTVEANGRVSSISTTAFSAATIGDILALSIALG